MASQNHNIFNTLRIQKEGIYHNLINSDPIKTNFVKVYNYKDLSLHSVRKSCSRNEKVSKEIIAQGGNYSSKCYVEMNLYSAGWTLTPTGLSVCDTGHPHRSLLPYGSYSEVLVPVLTSYTNSKISPVEGLQLFQGVLQQLVQKYQIVTKV